MTETMYDVMTVQRLAAQDDMDALAKRLAKAVYTGRGMRDQLVAQQVDVAAALTAYQRLRLVTAWADRYGSKREKQGVSDTLLLLSAIVGRGLDGDPLADARSARLASLTGRQTYSPWHSVGLDLLAEAEVAMRPPLAPEVVAVFRRTATMYTHDSGLRTLAKKLTEPPLNPGELWADTATAEATAQGESWLRLLGHAARATAAKPTVAWDKQARALIDAIGPEPVRAAVTSWLTLVGRPRTVPLERAEFESDINQLYDPYNANVLRGLVWTLSLLPSHRDTARALGALVETSLRKVAGTGPRNPKVANAAVVALGRADGEPALAELARLATRVTFKGTLKQIDAALEARAAALGLTREEIEELAVPSYGLTGVGRRPHEHGELAVHAARPY